jgi:hypothetical protein
MMPDWRQVAPISVLIVMIWRPKTVEAGPGSSPAAFDIEDDKLTGTDAGPIAEQGMTCYFADQARTELCRVRPIFEPRRVHQGRMNRSAMSTDVMDGVRQIRQGILKVDEIPERRLDWHWFLQSDFSHQPLVAEQEAGGIDF